MDLSFQLRVWNILWNFLLLIFPRVVFFGPLRDFCWRQLRRFLGLTGVIWTFSVDHKRWGKVAKITWLYRLPFMNEFFKREFNLLILIFIHKFHEPLSQPVRNIWISVSIKSRGVHYYCIICLSTVPICFQWYFYFKLINLCCLYIYSILITFMFFQNNSYFDLKIAIFCK